MAEGFTVAAAQGAGSLSRSNSGFAHFETTSDTNSDALDMAGLEPGNISFAARIQNLIARGRPDLAIILLHTALDLAGENTISQILETAMEATAQMYNAGYEDEALLLATILSGWGVASDLPKIDLQTGPAWNGARPLAVLEELRRDMLGEIQRVMTFLGDGDTELLPTQSLSQAHIDLATRWAERESLGPDRVEQEPHEQLLALEEAARKENHGMNPLEKQTRQPQIFPGLGSHPDTDITSKAPAPEIGLAKPAASTAPAPLI